MQNFPSTNPKGPSLPQPALPTSSQPNPTSPSLLNPPSLPGLSTTSFAQTGAATMPALKIPKPVPMLEAGLKQLLKWAWETSVQTKKPVTGQAIYSKYNAVPQGSNPRNTPVMQSLLQLAQVTQGKAVYIQDYGSHDLDTLLQHIFSLPDPLQWSDNGERGRFTVLDLLQTFFHLYVKRGEAKERIYINAQADCAITVFNFVCTSVLVLPGALGAKVSGPFSLERADNIVIYLESDAARDAALKILMPFARQNGAFFCDAVPKMTKQVELGIGIAIGAEPPSVDITSSPEDRIRKVMSQIEPLIANRLPNDPVAREQELRRIATENLHFSVLDEQASFGGFRSDLIAGVLEMCFDQMGRPTMNFDDFCRMVAEQFQVVGIDPLHPEVQSEKTMTQLMHRGAAISQEKRKKF